MAKRQSLLRGSKKKEVEIQRYLWPGTERPWEKAWDLYGVAEGAEWYGEVKVRGRLSFSDGLKLGREGMEQLKEALTREKTFGTYETWDIRLFVVIHQKGSPTPWVYTEDGQWRTLAEFKEELCSASDVGNN